MLYKNIIRLFFFLVFFVFNHCLYADNWYASVNSSIQSDNRFSSDNSISADALLSYAYDDADNDFHSRVNFLIRESDYSFQRGNELYELSIEKGWAEYNTRIKAGRFERSDNLGFYFLDGLNLTYQNTQKDLSVEFYMGKPGRIDDVSSISGDYLFGMELFSHNENNWHNKLLALVIDSWDIRFGLQKIKYDIAAHRVNLAVNTEGSSQTPEKESHCSFDCQRFKSQLLLTYHTEADKIEDLFVDVRIPVSQDLRLRFSYEYYQPEVDNNPGFRELFYSYYAFGNQKISQINVDYFVNKQISIFAQYIHSNREIGDKGLGYASGIKIRKPFYNTLDIDISLSVDSVELGNNTLDSVYFNLDHHFNSRLNVQLDSIYREEKKQLFGNNRVLGLNGKINYMAKNDLIFSFESREINNSRLRNEHLTRISMTYYFDNFKAKSRINK